MNQLLSQLILGAIQGITEWLPISSSAMLTFVMTNFFAITDIKTLILKSLFFHLGTFFAALIYFRHDVSHLIRSLFKYKQATIKTKNVLNFLIISTIISGILGALIGMFLFSTLTRLTGKTITITVAMLLLITGILQLTSRGGIKDFSNLKLSDSILLGIAQALAVIPGISRSGITVSTLMLKKFNDTTALRLSFLMSLPIVLAGNIFLNLLDIITTFTPALMIGLFSSFLFGTLTIHALMKLSKKINFGYFAILFAILMGLSVLI